MATTPITKNIFLNLLFIFSVKFQFVAIIAFLVILFAKRVRADFSLHTSIAEHIYSHIYSLAERIFGSDTLTCYIS